MLYVYVQSFDVRDNVEVFLETKQGLKFYDYTVCKSCCIPPYHHYVLSNLNLSLNDTLTRIASYIDISNNNQALANKKLIIYSSNRQYSILLIFKFSLNYVSVDFCAYLYKL